MALDPLAVSLVLLAALLHAGWNTLVKLGHDRLSALVLVKVPNMAVAAAVLAVADFPAPASWPYLLASTAATSAYFFCLANAYRVGDLSLAYPVARGSAPLSVLLLSLVAVGEVPTAFGLAGVLAVSLGITVIGFERGATPQHYRALAWAGGVGLSIAAYTVIDGLGGRASASPFGYTAALQILSGVVLVTAALALRGLSALAALRRELAKGLVGGTMMFLAYGIVIYAMTLAPMAPVAALRETGVVFAALIGTFVLGERFGRKRIAAAALVAAGIVVLVVFG